MKSRLNYLLDKITQVRYDELYSELELLATEIETIISIHRFDLETYRWWSQSLSEIRSLMLELIQTKNKKKLVPLCRRYRELEGKVKEMRNDLSSPERPERG